MSGNRGEKETADLIFFYGLISFVVFFDQFSKYLAVHLLSFEDSVPIIPDIFHLTLVRNPGIAFGIFNDKPALLLILITLSLAFLFLWSRKIQTISRAQRWALGLILGGAVGNWIDRVRLGSVS